MEKKPQTVRVWENGKIKPIGIQPLDRNDKEATFILKFRKDLAIDYRKQIDPEVIRNMRDVLSALDGLGKKLVVFIRDADNNIAGVKVIDEPEGEEVTALNE